MNLNHREIERLEYLVQILRIQISLLKKIIDDGLGNLSPEDQRRQKLEYFEGQVEFWSNPKNF